MKVSDWSGFFFQYWRLNLEPCTLESHPYPSCLLLSFCLFWDRVLLTLFRPASNHDPSASTSWGARVTGVSHLAWPTKELVNLPWGLHGLEERMLPCGLWLLSFCCDFNLYSASEKLPYRRSYRRSAYGVHVSICLNYFWKAVDAGSPETWLPLIGFVTQVGHHTFLYLNSFIVEGNALCIDYFMQKLLGEHVYTLCQCLESSPLGRPCLSSSAQWHGFTLFGRLGLIAVSWVPSTQPPQSPFLFQSIPIWM
jgi:hypothetical protein